ncbi:MAG: CCA tRNA nucleotidyltransferase [Hyphomicrobiaceae bacterium]
MRAQPVMRVLADAGCETRAVGGAVRNALMGLPVGDVDLATTAKPEETIKVCEAAGLKCVPTGLAHGTVTVLSDGSAYEVTTLREDVETFGRHAKVAYTVDWAADARRRDFTMNALYCAADGTVSDPLKGWPDLLARRVRFIGEPAERIGEDYLRILRFFRFHAEVGQGPLDAAGLLACVRERHGLARLSAERVRNELIKLLSAADPLAGIGPMFDVGLLSPLLHAAPRPGLLARLVAAEKAAPAPIDALLRLSALAVAVEDDIPALAERLRLSNAERDSLVVIDHNAAALGALTDQAARRVLYTEGAQQWQRRALAAAVAGAGPRWRTLYALPQSWQLPHFPLRGTDALALGVAPGPRIGELLAHVEAWWIERDFMVDEAALRRRLAELAR